MLKAHSPVYNIIRNVSTPLRDHYETLAVSKNATRKEIKAAFYELSKKLHPDANPETSSQSAQQFHNVVAAYEVLGSEDKKRAYDATLGRSAVRTTPNVHSRTSAGQHQKNFTDLDIDYKDFEHFQKTARRRRGHHDHFHMPDEFFSKFGGRTFKSTFEEENFIPHQSNFKDSQAAMREKEEWRLYQEMEELRKKQKHPLPTFEQLLREEQARKQQKDRQSNFVLGLATGAVLIGFVLASKR
jgi:DnaJ-class molecular chaperone